MAAIIDYIPRVTLSNFKELIKQQSETKETLFIRFTLKDIQYTVVMSVEKQKLIFFWEHQGKRNQKRDQAPDRTKQSWKRDCVVLSLSLYRS